MRENASIRAGALVLAIIIVFSAAAPLLAPDDPFSLDLAEGLSPATWDHPFGQDKLGRDIASRVFYGGRISLMVGFAAVFFSVLIGGAVGAVAGYAGGAWDEFLMRVTDVFMAFPGILLAIALMSVLEPRVGNVVLSLSAFGWVGYARLVRVQVLSLREREYVVAARAAGARPLRVVVRHILLNIISPVIVEASFGMAGAIVAEAGLSFLGLGVQPPAPSWGAMLAEGRDFLLIAPHLTLFPGIALALTVMSLNILGDGLRDLLDPAQKR
ncbi:MAG: ABC transporter permease [Nitrospinota bacterium]|nr:ABC transporter permease [Nitrospinota bacterium]MDP7369538.1 ABC transporter permease [Nitrospinota bacterium]MDP7503706.1 ABC transporter permease [Nitrospinota bacterium]MDP7663080.1 ABC transporter permease [Nitrospinota bacterium]